MSDRPASSREPAPPNSSLRAHKWWYAAMTLGGFAFGLVAERRPFGPDVLAHPLVVYFVVVGIALIGLRVACARPVPEVIPERALLFGCFAGMAVFLAGNFTTVYLIGSPR